MMTENKGVNQEELPTEVSVILKRLKRDTPKLIHLFCLLVSLYSSFCFKKKSGSTSCKTWQARETFWR